MAIRVEQASVWWVLPYPRKTHRLKPVLLNPNLQKVPAKAHIEMKDCTIYDSRVTLILANS